MITAEVRRAKTIAGLIASEPAMARFIMKTLEPTFHKPSM